MTHQQQTAFENIVGKGEIAHNEQFLLFQQCFLLNQIILSPFVYILDIISLFAAEFEEPKIGISGKGLTKMTTEAFVDSVDQDQSVGDMLSDILSKLSVSFYLVYFRL